MAYHDGESLGTDVEGQNFEGVSDEHGGVCDVIEEVEDENEGNCRCMRGSVHCTTPNRNHDTDGRLTFCCRGILQGTKKSGGERPCSEVYGGIQCQFQ